MADRKDIIRLLIKSTCVFLVLFVLAAVLIANSDTVLSKAGTYAVLKGQSGIARRMAERISDDELAGDLRNQCDYADALKLMAAGKDEDAIACFIALGDYLNSEDLLKDCKYAMAAAAEAKGEYESAAGIYQELGSWGDSRDARLRCIYAEAESVSEDDPARAAELFLSIADYSDALIQASGLAVKITGIDDVETALNSLKGISPAEAELMAELSAEREKICESIIAVGFRHTVALKEDGTLLACGDNSFGQCELEGLTSVIAVKAGAYHTVALHADGTVSAVGRNDEGQCEVRDWNSVIAITASDYSTYGLCADGTLLSTGNIEITNADAYSGVSAIRAGSFGYALLFKDGSISSFRCGDSCSSLSGIVDAAVGTGYTAAITGSGRLVSPAFAADPDGVYLAVSGSGTSLLAIDRDRNVYRWVFRGDLDWNGSGMTLNDGASVCSDAVAIACGGTHFAAVKKDGSVFASGYNSCGQCETSGWRLFN